MNPRTRSRTPASMGSNQSSNKYPAVSAAGCEESDFLVMFSMAWSPVRRTNAGRFEVDHPGDYATLNSYHPVDGTCDVEAGGQKPPETQSRFATTPDI